MGPAVPELKIPVLKDRQDFILDNCFFLFEHNRKETPRESLK